MFGEIFSHCVTDYKNKTILDFGGNHGNLIKSSKGKILEKNYTCLDVSKKGLDLLPKNVKRIHWNRFHSLYNPTGNKDEMFPNLDKYDIVFANSVFTHMPVSEIIYCITHLIKCSNRICFTYIDPTCKQFFDQVKKNHQHPIHISDKQFEDLNKHNVSYLNNKNIVNDKWIIIKTDYLKMKISNSVDRNLQIVEGNTPWFNSLEINVLE